MRQSGIRGLAVAGALLAAAPAPASAGSEPVVATRLSSPPTIDGKLDDAAWQSVPLLRELVQEFPDQGGPPSERSEIRLGYDDRAIYLAVRCLDSQPGEIVATLTRRDRDVSSDAVVFDLDSRGDQLSAFHFEVSAAGVQRDALRTGDQAFNYDWNAVWRSAARLDATGWTAEIAVPLAALRFDETQLDRWRLQLRRFIARKSETDALVLIPRTEHGEMLRYAPVVGVSNLAAPRGIHLWPFALSRVRARPLQTDLRWQGGLDARYGLTSGLTLDATVLPDFGQVEADQVVLNLSTFEVRFPEKRPFFLEGSELLSLKTAYGNPLQAAQVFYSRRIGAAPPKPTVDLGNELVDAPEQVRLLGAVKLGGKVTDAISLAMVDGVTAEESAVLRAPDGTGLQQLLAPAANTLTARAQALLGRGWSGGLTVANVLRLERPGSMVFEDRCPGRSNPGDDGRCTHDALTAALDSRWESRDGSWLFTGVGLASVLRGGPARTLQDGTTLASGDLGLGARLELARASGYLVADLISEAYGPKLDLNDAGFLRSQNFHRSFAKVGWRSFDTGPLRQNQVSIQAFYRQSFDGVPIERGVQLLDETTWRSFWKSSLLVGTRPVQFDNRETRDGSRTQRAFELSTEWSLSTDPSRPFSGSTSGSAWTTWRGYGVDGAVGIRYRPPGRLTLALDATLTRVAGDPRWVATSHPADGSTVYRFGLQDALAPGATLQGTMTFTPQMTLQLYAQLFFASVRYGQLYELSGTSAPAWLHLADFAPVDADASKYETRDAVLNLDLIFRYEYLPGSVLYLVFTRSHAGGQVPLDPTVRPRLDFGALRSAPVENTFLVKCSYYFGG